MNNSSVKKQNRVLLAALVVILAAAAILIAVTGSANKKDAEENPPLDTKLSETSSESGKIDPKTAETTKSGTSEDAIAETKTDEKIDSGDESKGDNVKDSSAEIPDTSDEVAVDSTDDGATEVSANVSNVLPTFTAPVDALVIKDFSADVPVFSCTMNDYRTHNGVDFACSVGTPVYAAADGVVCEVVDDPMMGITVGISHSGGAVTKYKGLSEESMGLLSVGDNVARGQLIGASGETALIESAEEAHLHFELEVNGEHEDPGEFMNLSYLSDMLED